MNDAPKSPADVSTPLSQFMLELQAEVRAIARREMARERKGHTLQPTALVSEVYLRLAAQRNIATFNRTEFLAAAANTMRRILIDHAKAKLARKRGGGEGRRVTISDIESPESEQALDLLLLDDALKALEAQSPRRHRVVECRYFSGMKVDEIAAALKISPRTVADDLVFAKAWLRREMGS